MAQVYLHTALLEQMPRHRRRILVLDGGGIRGAFRRRVGRGLTQARVRA